MNIWNEFLRLHLSLQIVLALGVIILLALIAINHTAEENLVNFLFALQSILIHSKVRSENQ